MRISHLIEIVSSIETCDESLRDWGAPASQVLSDLDKVNEESGSEEETPVCSLSDTKEFIYKLRHFAKHHGDTHMLSNIMSINDDINVMFISGNQQKPITDFFKRKIKVKMHVSNALSMNYHFNLHTS